MLFRWCLEGFECNASQALGITFRLLFVTIELWYDTFIGVHAFRLMASKAGAGFGRIYAIVFFSCGSWNSPTHRLDCQSGCCVTLLERFSA